MQGYEVATVEDYVEQADVFVTATGNFGIITAEHMARMKDKAIVGNIGHFDNEIDMAGLAKVPGIERVNIKPQYDEWVFPDGHSVLILAEGRLLNLGCATGHPSFVMSASFTNQVLAQLELWQNAEAATRSTSTCCRSSSTRRWRGCTSRSSACKLTTAHARSRPSTSACRSTGRTSRTTIATERLGRGARSPALRTSPRPTVESASDERCAATVSAKRRPRAVRRSRSSRARPARRATRPGERAGTPRASATPKRRSNSADVDAGDPAQPGDDEVAARLRVGEPLLARDGGAVLRRPRRASGAGARTFHQRRAGRGRRRRSARRGRAEVVGAVPVARVVARREARARPARDLVALVARRAARRSAASVGHRALDVVVDRDQAAARAPGVEGRALLPGERVGRDVLGRERERRGEVGLPRRRATGRARRR